MGLCEISCNPFSLSNYANVPVSPQWCNARTGKDNPESHSFARLFQAICQTMTFALPFFSPSAARSYAKGHGGTELQIAVACDVAFFSSSTSPVTSQLRWKNVARQNAPCLISHVLFKQPFSNPQIACWTLLHIAPTILMFSKNYGLVNNKTTTERDPKSCTDKIFHETASPVPLPSSTSAVELRRKKTALTHFAHTNGSLITLHTPLFSHEKGRDLSPNTKKKPRRNAFATLKHSQFSATLQVRRIQGRRKKRTTAKKLLLRRCRRRCRRRRSGSHHRKAANAVLVPFYSRRSQLAGRQISAFGRF